MGILFVGAQRSRTHPSPADPTEDEHVRVGPAAGLGVGGRLILGESDRPDAAPGVVDVARGAPSAAADRGAPFPDLIVPILAETEDDVALLRPQLVTHDLEGMDRIGVVLRTLPDRHAVRIRDLAAHDLTIAAPIIFQEVVAPLGEGAGVLRLVQPAPGALAARRRTGRGVDAGLQAAVVDIIRQALHVGEAHVGGDDAAFVAERADQVLERLLVRGEMVLPVVVDVHVSPAVVGQTAADHRVRGALDLFRRDRLGEAVPTVPTHRRGQRDGVPADDAEALLRRTAGVPGPEGDDGFTFGGKAARDPPRLRIQLQAGRQTLRGVGQRALAGDGDRIEERRTRADAEDGRPVDARRGRGRRSQDIRRDRRRGLLTRGPERLRARRLETGVRPIGIVIVVAILGIADLEQQLLHSGDVHFQGLRFGAGTHDAAAPEHPAVADDEELHARTVRAALGVIEADLGGERLRAAVERDHQDAFRDRTDAALEGLAADLERAGLFRLLRGMPVLHGPSVALDDRLEVQVIEPDGLGGEP